jgi:hypothetical protein
MEKETEVLKCPGDSPLGNRIRGKPKKAFSLEKDFSAIGVVDARDAIEKGGFSRPVGADDGEDLLRFHLEIKTRQGLDTTKTDRQFPDVEKRHAG